MKLTALVCTNGWVAIYGPTGIRLATYPPGNDTVVAQVLQDPNVTITQVDVPNDPRYKDFPSELHVHGDGDIG